MGDKKGDINQIGKFGVGFYSSFMVSDQVVVRSKKYDSSSGYLWTSDGKGTFSIEQTKYNEIGTEITLSIKKDEKEFLSKYKIEEIGQVESKEIFKDGEKLADSVSTGKVKASEPTEAGSDAPF